MGKSPLRPRSGRSSGDQANGLALGVPAELVEAIAERAADLVLDRLEARDGGDGWLRGAEAIGRYIDAPASRVYALAACNPQRIPVHRDGSALVARRSDLDGFMRDGGDRRP